MECRIPQMISPKLQYLADARYRVKSRESVEPNNTVWTINIGVTIESRTVDRIRFTL